MVQRRAHPAYVRRPGGTPGPRNPLRPRPRIAGASSNAAPGLGAAPEGGGPILSPLEQEGSHTPLKRSPGKPGGLNPQPHSCRPISARGVREAGRPWETGAFSVLSPIYQPIVYRFTGAIVPTRKGKPNSSIRPILFLLPLAINRVTELRLLPATNDHGSNSPQSERTRAIHRLFVAVYPACSRYVHFEGIP